MARRSSFLSGAEIAAASPEDLAAHFMPLANRLAAAVRPNCADTRSDAYLGLVRAAEAYDSAKGPFVPYATLWIRQAITRGTSGQRNAVHLPMAVRQRLAAVLDCRNRLPPDATDGDIADALGGDWTAEQVTRVRTAARAVPDHANADTHDSNGGDSRVANSADMASFVDSHQNDELDAAVARADLEAICDSLPEWLAVSVREWLAAPNEDQRLELLAGRIRRYLNGETLF